MYWADSISHFFLRHSGVKLNPFTTPHRYDTLENCFVVNFLSYFPKYFPIMCGYLFHAENSGPLQGYKLKSKCFFDEQMKMNCFCRETCYKFQVSLIMLLQSKAQRLETKGVDNGAVFVCFLLQSQKAFIKSIYCLSLAILMFQSSLGIIMRKA